ncbi:Potassium voltage-gated channel subfamily C member 2 [Merluccius polli]|uniref:Potassium voltage-gated channel subfamily C member 2 n=1 Tax=Merluccius polli TaxID=89951 RepID=A0AA47MVR0_MERPO|nr:Potassium voltage-gated channel subfamily C member 2 [Merluccius polli]
MYPVGQTDRGRQTDRQADRQAGRQADRQTGLQPSLECLLLVESPPITRVGPTASASYEKSRSLTNISGGSSLRLAPISSPSYEPFETPAPLHRCRSPIPSIL